MAYQETQAERTVRDTYAFIGDAMSPPVKLYKDHLVEMIGRAYDRHNILDREYAKRISDIMEEYKEDTVARDNEIEKVAQEVVEAAVEVETWVHKELIFVNAPDVSQKAQALMWKNEVLARG